MTDQTQLSVPATEVIANSGDYYQFNEINLAILRLMRERARPGAAVLDLGCGRGRLGAELRRLGYRVTGVDAVPAACGGAEEILDEAFNFDLTDAAAASAALAERRFDWIVAADVLEHLVEPTAALKYYRRFLAPEGRVVISVPNVAVWFNRFRILAGRFDYAESGVMDRRHLRFFTMRSARRLLLEAGYAPVGIETDPGIARAFAPMVRKIMRRRAVSAGPDAILNMPLYRFYERRIWPIERALCRIAPGLLAYRIVIEAALSDS
jgi:2-polyprenyl-3-methyl-5-hydroxy-6-metoxy-1,4-benzoquinol methylase